MSELFIQKIREKILIHLGNEKFSVGDLASEMGLSRSQILRKVRSATGKSVNQFIREVRLDEAIKLLKNNDLTASEIAYQVGFSSPSYFNKCFLDRYGLTPGEYKKKLEENEQFDVSQRRDKSAVKFTRNRVGVLVVLMIVVVAGYLMLGKTFERDSNVHQASIAVLPFLDLSENKDKDYWADGITEAITLELSKNESLRVISRGSPMMYKGEKKLYSEIAKELNVDLLLEGSVLFGTDSLRVVVQLIEPLPKEKHLWASSYSQKFSNILQVVNHVSNEIAGEITSIIEPQPGKTKVYRVNPKAYDLYLRGRHLWNNQKTRYQSLLTALDYLDQSVKIDSGFAPAYVTIAETYLSINTLISNGEERLKYNEYAEKAVDKAFALDSSLAEVYITKANIAGKIDWNWDATKELVGKGLKLEPNNSYGHIILSNYWTVKGNYKNAIDEAKVAETLDPLNPINGCLVAERYFIAGDYKKSIEKYNEVVELAPDYGWALHGLGYAYWWSGDRENSVKSWLRLQRILGNDSLAWYYTHKTMEDGFRFYLRQAKKSMPSFCPNPMVRAAVYMMVNDDKGAMEYLNQACQYKNVDLPVMLTYPDFKPLHSNPEFREIAHKVGVVFPD